MHCMSSFYRQPLGRGPIVTPSPRLICTRTGERSCRWPRLYISCSGNGRERHCWPRAGLSHRPAWLVVVGPGRCRGEPAYDVMGEWNELSFLIYICDYLERDHWPRDGCMGASPASIPRRADGYWTRPSGSTVDHIDWSSMASPAGRGLAWVGEVRHARVTISW